jgi:microcystin-dependent protein
LDTTIYSGLFAIIGYSFGGSGGSFSAPDLRGQVAGAIGTGTYAGASTRTIGEFVGEETHTLITAEMPSHNHLVSAGVLQNGGGVAGGGIFGTITPINTGNTGGDGAHNTMQPTLFVGNYFIYAGM